MRNTALARPQSKSIILDGVGSFEDALVVASNVVDLALIGF